MAKYDKPAKLLAQAASKHCLTHGSDLCDSIEDASGLLLSWLSYLHSCKLTGSADELVSGVQSAVIETSSCLCLGLVRPAVFSLRAEVDMLLSWLYFKDHPLEWQHLQREGEGFRLRKDVLTYLEKYCADFKGRFARLTSARTTEHQDPYRLLSAHVHCQHVPAIPDNISLHDVVADISDCTDCVEIQRHVSEYLSDLLIAVFADEWASLPHEIMEDVKKRFHPGALKAVFAW